MLWIVMVVFDCCGMFWLLWTVMHTFWLADRLPPHVLWMGWGGVGVGVGMFTFVLGVGWLLEFWFTLDPWMLTGL